MKHVHELRHSLIGALRLVPPLGKGLVVGLLSTLLLTLSLADPVSAAPGDLDLSFGSGGKVTTDFGFSELASDLAIQADGKIVVVGTSSGGFNTNFVLARYNVDGSLDATFGSGGKVTTDFGGVDTSFALALQADGKIVVSGEHLVCCHIFRSDFALARYNPDGSLDASFGSGGKVISDLGSDDSAHAIVIQPDGRIVVAGSNRNFALARYNPDGSLDASFGSGGKVTTLFGGVAFHLALQADGKIVAAGRLNTLDDFGLARYNPDGSPDATFGSGGKVISDFGGGDFAYAMALQADGKIIVAGGSTNAPAPGGERDVTLARYNANGSLDAIFGGGGKVNTDFGADDAAFALAIQLDGKIVVAGGSFVSGRGTDFILARYQGGPTAAVELSGSAFRTGETITYQATLTSGSTKIDIYLGALSPDGVTFISLVEAPSGEISIVGGPSPIPFQADMTLTHSVVSLSYTFGGSEAIGVYFSYAGITIAGSDPLQSANQLALAIQAFEFNP